MQLDIWFLHCDFVTYCCWF